MRLDPKLPPDDRLMVETEYHKRWALAVACLIFSLIGVGLATNTDRRSAKSGGMVLCIGLIVSYWVVYITCDSLARSGKLPPAPAMWAADAIFAVMAVFTLRKAWNH